MAARPVRRPVGRVTLARMTTTTTYGRLEDELVQRLMHQRIIVLGEALEEGNGNRLMHQLLLLSAEDPRADISLWINSPGGSVSAMLAIHDVMRLIPNDVSTLAMGMAASAGQFLLSAGTPGQALRPARTPGSCCTRARRGSAAPRSTSRSRPRTCGRPATPCSASSPSTPARTSPRSSGTRAGTAGSTRQEALAYGFVDRVICSVEDVTPGHARDRWGWCA